MTRAFLNLTYAKTYDYVWKLRRSLQNRSSEIRKGLDLTGL